MEPSNAAKIIWRPKQRLKIIFRKGSGYYRNGKENVQKGLILSGREQKKQCPPEDEMHQKQKRIPSTGAQKAMVGRSIEQTRKNMQRLRVQRIGCPVRGKEKNVGRESLQMTIQSFIFMNQLLFFASKLQYSLQYMFCVNKIPLTISHLK